MVFFVTFNTRLVFCAPMVSRPSGDSCFYLGVTVEAFCPDDGLSYLMTGCTVGDSFQRSVGFREISRGDLRDSRLAGHNSSANEHCNKTDIVTACYHIHV